MEQHLKQRVTGNVAVSVYCRPIKETTPFVYEDKLMPAASLIKVPIMMAAFLLEKRDEFHFADKVKIHDAVEGGSFYNLPDGTEVSIYDLVFHMIVESDNTSANLLMDILGMHRINTFIQILSLEHTVLRRKMMDFDAARRGLENTTSVSEMGRLFGMLYDGQCLDPRSDDNMLNILAQQEDNCILPAQIPNQVRVAHKTGELDGIYHDCGIVYKPGNPYICCLMAEGITDEPQTLYDLSYLAKDIYDAII